MKIGIDGRALVKKRTGIGTYTYEIIKQLNDMDKKNEYYIYSNKKIYIDFTLNNNFYICEYQSKIGTMWLYKKLPKILNKDKIEIFWGTQHCLPKRNKYTKNIKYILTIHDLAIQKIKNVGSMYNTIVQKLILRKSCINANKIIAVSKATKNDIVQCMKIKENKIDVIYEGIIQSKNSEVQKEKYEEIRQKFNLENDKFIFFLSTIEPRKNLDTAIKAFELYKYYEKDNLKFVISGGKGWKNKKTFKLIDNSNYKSDIIVTGYITEEEKNFFFLNCEAYIYPSLYEGFGLPILEAMKNKAIVITTDVSSIPEVAGNAVLYLNDCYDIEQLYKLIKKSIGLSITEKEILINNGIERVKLFTWKKCTENILKEIEKL